jgi:hypothetical protein
MPALTGFPCAFRLHLISAGPVCFQRAESDFGVALNSSPVLRQFPVSDWQFRVSCGLPGVVC